MFLKNRENPWILDIRANVASAVASRNPKAALLTLNEVIDFCHTGKRFYLGKFI